ncbi:MAG: bifunctional metallophosphatase/5'-nucleotidase [Bacteroidaceae bacterium]|nr:bifunctional metallophosphatase/5'-nucleotidase [Bacteroidaceae bacterium]
MKDFFKLFFLVSFLLPVACSDEKTENNTPDLPSKPIVILYENDVHCSVDGYPILVSLRNECLTGNGYVSTVSCGDFASGGIVGAISKGEQIVKIMNYVGYDAIALGNHELDYGITQMFNITDSLNAPVLCANLKNIQTDEYPYPAYHIVSYGDVDIAYIGFTTTTSGTVTSLSDEQGNPLYSFMREDFYDNAQHYIDEARGNGADYIIALSHLGDSQTDGMHPSSTSLIANTTGLDAVIDGHDHHTIEEQFINDKNGKPVLLTSSGSNFQYVGKLTIDTDGGIRSTLVSTDNGGIVPDNNTVQFVNKIKDEVESLGNFVIGHSEVDLMIYDENGKRIVRKQETNIGDFCADAFRAFTDADIALVNGGGIRANMNQGEILFNDLYNVMPFGDMIATGSVTGEQLLDVLEYAVSYLPAEAGVFMQVSGLRFKINPDIPSPAAMDSVSQMFSHIEDGERRVSDVEILDKQSGEYRDIELSREYTMATLDYLILELGGSGIFKGVEPHSTYYGADIEILRSYLENNLGGTIGSEYSKPQDRIIFVNR